MAVGVLFIWDPIGYFCLCSNHPWWIGYFAGKCRKAGRALLLCIF